MTPFWSIDVAITANKWAGFAYELKMFLCAHGGTIRISSDGVTDHSGVGWVGDWITGPGAGVGGFNNSGAWMVLTWTLAGVAIEIMLCRATSGAGYAWVTCSIAGYTGGAIATPPTAIDDENLWASGVGAGSLTDLTSGDWCSMFVDTDTGMVWCVSTHNLTGALGTAFLLLPFVPGSVNPLDAAPFALWMATGPTIFSSGVISATTQGPKSWFRYGEADQAWSTWGMDWGNWELRGEDGWGYYGLLAVPLVRLDGDAPDGPRGVCDLILATSQGTTVNKNTYSVAAPGARDWIVFDEVAFRWNGSVPAHLTAASTDYDGYIVQMNAQAGGAVDVTPPAVSNDVPPLNSVIARNITVSFDVTDNVGFTRIIVLVRYPSGIYEVIHDGDKFSAVFITTSTRTIISGGYHFSVLRTGYWLENPTIRIVAIDTGGNEAL